MSYDLYLSSLTISPEEFNSYFEKRLYYSVSDGQALYSNNDTGVYFTFDYNDELPMDEDDIEYSVAFNMNYFRPHYFALEAEPEVKKFINNFSCTIDDPQMGGMDNDQYSTVGFLRGWNCGNQVGYKAFTERNISMDQVFSKPAEELESIWSWNFHKAERYEKIKEDIFIPSIMFGTLQQKLISFCIWPDGISTLIPEVDYLYIPRKKLAPKKWFIKTKEDICLLPKDQYSKFLAAYLNDDFELPAYWLPTPNTPAPIGDYVGKLKKCSEEISRVPYDSVLDLELLSEAQHLHKN
jgi:hypothetical protein